MTNIPVKVVQSDRDAAADFSLEYSGRTASASADMYRAGEKDDSAAVQAFARHRQSSTTELVELLREAREALAWFAGLARYLPADMHDAEFCDQDEVALQAGHLRRAAAVLARISTLLEQRGGQ